MPALLDQEAGRGSGTSSCREYLGTEDSGERSACLELRPESALIASGRSSHACAWRRSLLKTKHKHSCKAGDIYSSQKGSLDAVAFVDKPRGSSKEGQDDNESQDGPEKSEPNIRSLDAPLMNKLIMIVVQ